jgi:hypothetical protein
MATLDVRAGGLRWSIQPNVAVVAVGSHSSSWITRNIAEVPGEASGTARADLAVRIRAFGLKFRNRQTREGQGGRSGDSVFCYQLNAAVTIPAMLHCKWCCKRANLSPHCSV